MTFVFDDRLVCLCVFICMPDIFLEPYENMYHDMRFFFCRQTAKVPYNSRALEIQEKYPISDQADVDGLSANK